VTRDGDIAWITIDNPPVNATSTAVRTGLADAVRKIDGARVAILRCAGKTFVAGGDMSEFDKPPVEPHLPDVINLIERSKTPILAAMHGTVLGGGFELAMACAWRIALPGTRFGLPEVNVGLVPGAGGSQRLPRLIGMDAAINVACRGQLLSAQELLEMGGLDSVVEANLEIAARQFISQQPTRPIPVGDRKIHALDTVYWDRQKSELEKTSRGAMAPLENLKALQWAQLPLAEGMARERALHLELRNSAESKALRHVFFAERAASRPKALADASPRDITEITIVGGGLMGAGIAAACLFADYRVTMLEADPDAAAVGAKRVADLLDGALRRGKIDASERDQKQARFRSTTDYSLASTADLAIEAVFEDLAVKKSVFENLSAAMAPDAILATNTSYLDPQEIFAGIENPDRCLGLHFFSPAHIMRLLEIVRTPETSKSTLATAFSLARRLGKQGVMAGICDGFIGNRMLSAYRRQADYFLADGALPHQIDAAMRHFGMPMGPYELQDLTGLQIAWANRKRHAQSRDPRERYVPIADRICEMGRLGQRAGRGWYRYENDTRNPERDPEVEALIIDYSAEMGIKRREFSEAEIQERLMAVLFNEGALIVEEGIAEQASDVDIVQIHGYGFPRWRGGPMHFGAQLGMDIVASAMNSVKDQSENSWRLSKQLS
jgi:3-hydroxyacyl-CoA dehydrogenase